MKKAVQSSSVLLIMVLALTLTTSPAQATPLPIWVKMLGYVNSYDEDVASGLLVARARIGGWADVRAIYVPGRNYSEYERPGEIPPNFTVSFHVVRLVNVTEVKLNYEGNDFYVSGLWNVWNVTFVYYSVHNWTLILKPVVIHGYGELNVTGTWKDFTLDITGNKLISGRVIFGCIKFIVIPIGDVYGPEGTPDYSVDLWDLQHIAHAYGSTPGNPWRLNYNFGMDFDCDYKIGLAELTTIAANLGTEY